MQSKLFLGLPARLINDCLGQCAQWMSFLANFISSSLTFCHTQAIILYKDNGAKNRDAEVLWGLTCEKSWEIHPNPVQILYLLIYSSNGLAFHKMLANWSLCPRLGGLCSTAWDTVPGRDVTWCPPSPCCGARGSAHSEKAGPCTQQGRIFPGMLLYGICTVSGVVLKLRLLWIAVLKMLLPLPLPSLQYGG